MNRKLFQLSIAGVHGRYSKLLEKRPDYGDAVTFENVKNIPVYNWFYFKEAFSPRLIWRVLDEVNIKNKIKKGSYVLDPFCGVGTTLLACKDIGYNSIGFDILPLCVFVSNTKLQDDYDMAVLKEKIDEITSLRCDKKKRKWPDIKFFDIKRAYPHYTYSDILFLREKIMEIEDEKIRNFLFLGLLSIIIGSGNVKRDGGVLKIIKRRNIPPVRILLKNRLRRMYKDLKERKPLHGEIKAEARLGDARDLSVKNDFFDICITSPPYLNWVDYTKVYALELSLLLNSGREISRLRKRTLRSHIGAKKIKKISPISERLFRTMEILRENPDPKKRPEIVEGYFSDIYLSLKSIYASLRDNGIAVIVIGNSCMPSLTIDSDLIMAELSEDIGFDVEKIMVANVRWCDVHGIKKERPVRESILILSK